jgi:hypothetical protein
MKSSGFVTSGTLVVATVSALFLVAACHSSPRANSFSATAADKATEARLAGTQEMPHLVPYDEGFYVPPADGAATDQ